MGLEEDIQKLKEIEQGEVERTIKTISDCESEMKINSDEQTDYITQYEALIKQKLPIALDNIILLKEYISSEKLDREDIIKRKPKGTSELILKNSFGLRVLLRMIFKKNNLEEISLYEGSFSRLSNIFTFGIKWRKYSPIIQTKSSFEFAEKISPYIVKELLNERHYNPLIDLVNEIINTPQKIRKNYFERKKENERKISRIKEIVEDFEKIKISSF